MSWRAWIPVSIVADGVPVEPLGRDQPVVALFRDPDLAVPKREFEERDRSVFHEPRGDRPAAHAGELLLGEADVPHRLSDPDPVLAALGLDGDDIVAAALVDPDVQLVDLYLADPFTVVRGWFWRL